MRTSPLLVNQEATTLINQGNVIQDFTRFFKNTLKKLGKIIENRVNKLKTN
jgi:hypothetical protein